MYQSLNKKSLIYLGIVLVVAIFVGVGLIYYFSMPAIEISTEEEPISIQEVIKSLTVPDGKTEPISEKTRNDLSVTAQATDSNISEEILKNLTVPK